MDAFENYSKGNVEEEEEDDGFAEAGVAEAAESALMNEELTDDSPGEPLPADDEQGMQEMHVENVNMAPHAFSAHHYAPVPGSYPYPVQYGAEMMHMHQGQDPTMLHPPNVGQQPIHGHYVSHHDANSAYPPQAPYDPRIAAAYGGQYHHVMPVDLPGQYTNTPAPGYAGAPHVYQQVDRVVATHPVHMTPSPHPLRETFEPREDMYAANSGAFAEGEPVESAKIEPVEHIGRDEDVEEKLIANDGLAQMAAIAINLAGEKSSPPRPLVRMPADSANSTVSTPARSNPSGAGALSPAQRQNLTSIVMGASKKSAPDVSTTGQTASLDAVMLVTTNEGKETERSDAIKSGLEDLEMPPTSSSKETRRKKPQKQVRKVLVAKKEREQARSLLRGKRDLTDLVSRRDAVFLGTNFWIFTVEQLRFVLRSQRMISSLDQTDKERKERVEKAYMIRREIVKKLAERDATSVALDKTGNRSTEATKGRSERIIASSENHKAKTAEVDDFVPDAINPSKDVSLTQEGATVSTTIDEMVEEKGATLGEKMSATVGEIVGSAEMEGKAETAGKAETERPGKPSLIDGSAAGIVATQDTAALMDSWEAVLANAEDVPWSGVEERFALDGAIACLFPKTLLNFLASLRIANLYGFFCVKRTETGAVCDYFRFWRDECGMTQLHTLALAKFLLGISYRLEQAISAVPPVDNATRLWMSDPMVCLTGAAREFLLHDRNIYTALEFVDTRTKDLALALQDWRASKGMEPLKGSGKVAMISGWKASAREAIEAQLDEGKVLGNIDLEGHISYDFPVFVKEPTLPDSIGINNESTTEAPPVAKSVVLPNLSKAGQYAAHSELFLIDVLGEAVTKILKGVGIQTAADLFETSVAIKPELAEAMLAAARVDNKLECETVVKEWCRSLRDHLNQFKSTDEVNSRSTEPPAAKRSKRKVTAPVKQHARRAPTLAILDPFEALSAVSQAFLTSIDVRTAEQFLSARTTDIAHEFVKFREQNAMPELKGLGSIASVSTWKSTCRKIAKEMGLDQLAELEPPNKFAHGAEVPADRRVRIKRGASEITKENSAQDGQTSAFAHEDVLCGKARKIFAIQCTHDSIYKISGGDPSSAPSPSDQHRFELTVRRRDRAAEAGLYISYKGRGLPYETEEYLARSSVISFQGKTTAVLREVPLSRGSDKSKNIDLRASFSAANADCGVFDLALHDVRPLRSQELAVVCENLRQFISTPALKGGDPIFKCDEITENMANVWLCRTENGGYGYMLHVEKPLQRGQTTEIIFPPACTVFQQDRHSDIPNRMRILLDESFRLLAKTDLRNLISYLSSETVERSREDADFKPFLSKQRIHWVAHRIRVALGSSTLEDDGALENLCFNRRSYFEQAHINDLPQSHRRQLQKNISDEVERDVLSVVEFDPICGRSCRGEWCLLHRTLFDSLLAEFCSSYVSFEEPAAEKVEVEYVSILAKALRRKLEVNECVVGAGSPSDGLVISIPINGSGGSTAINVSTLMVAPHIVRDGKAALSASWYYHKLLKIAETMVVVFGQLDSPRLFPADKIITKMQDAVFEKCESMNASEEKSRFGPVVHALKPLRAEAYEPHSTPFVLGIVWPALQQLRWRMDAGSDPSDVTYLSPSPKGQTTQHRLLREQRLRQQEVLSREVENLGLGLMSKVVKRVIISVTPEVDDYDDTSAVASIVDDTPDTEGVTASAALTMYLENALADFSYQDETRKNKLESIMGALRECFDSLAPSLRPKLDGGLSPQPPLLLRDGQRASDVLGSDVMMRFLTLLPCILRQSGLAMEYLDDSLLVASDVSAFLAANCKKLFDDSSQPSHEKYSTEECIAVDKIRNRLGVTSPKRLIEPCTESLENVGIGLGGITTIMTADEKVGLSDFTVLVMEQVIACRATDEDIKKKYRRIEKSHPGLACRHCKGSDGEGRYFFSSHESLMTATSAIEKHLMRCQHTPSTVKDDIVDCRARHTEQRKALASGAQAAFFTNLWARLHSSRLAENETIMMHSNSTIAGKNEEVMNSSQASDEETEFRDHLLLLDHIRTKDPWKDNASVREALNQYYNCLDYGGRIYNTASMPNHFSSEWLLAKVVPKRVSSSKPNMPG